MQVMPTLLPTKPCGSERLRTAADGEMDIFCKIRQWMRPWTDEAVRERIGLYHSGTSQLALYTTAVCLPVGKEQDTH